MNRKAQAIALVFVQVVPIEHVADLPLAATKPASGTQPRQLGKIWRSRRDQVIAEPHMFERCAWLEEYEALVENLVHGIPVVLVDCAIDERGDVEVTSAGRRDLQCAEATLLVLFPAATWA